MININGSHDPRLQISTPVAQAQQMHQYQSVYQAQGMVLPRAMSSASGMIAPQVNDSTMSSRGTSYYRPQGVGFNDAISPMHSSSGLLASGAPMGTNVGSSPESADYSQSSGMPTANVAISSSPLQQYQHQQHQNQQQQYQQRESMFSSSSYGVPSMYIPQHVSMLAYQAGGAPTDEQRILSLQDLNTVTKKSVRAQLTIDYGVDLTARKEFIGNAIELILAGKL
ncbi:hypothetical protein LPJ66_007749 [Kickxella alabastrina]|uniref:Uncharacterized protein n=1 Tax=Kickxella alabastrina TaxID=61397 RepID=A0ACC1I8M0_9FUNG|nr:hypothetical protein LPJ66_007749 [Kickxella alabastrina]